MNKKQSLCIEHTPELVIQIVYERYENVNTPLIHFSFDANPKTKVVLLYLCISFEQYGFWNGAISTVPWSLSKQ